MEPVRGVRSTLAGRETGKRRAPRKPKSEEAGKPATETAEQLTNEQLAADNPTAEMPVMVKNGRMAVNYVKPHFECDKDDTRSVGFELSFPLQKEHERYVPKEIREAWDILKQGNVKALALMSVGSQFVELGLASEGDDRDLEIKNAAIEKVQLASIEEKGTGEATEVIRLSFRVMAELDDDVERFACRHFGKTIWVKMEAVQGSLL